MSSESDEQRPLLLQGTPSYQTVESTVTKANTPAPLNKPTRADLCWLMVAMCSAVFLGALDGTIVATLLTSIGSDFDRAHQASYLGTAYLLSVAAFTPLYGRLSDIIGRKGAMLLALSLFGSGTILCGIAPTMETLIIARAIAGMGGGGIMTVSSITVSDLVPLKDRGLYQGIANILFGLGSGLGGPIGGLVNDRIGWRFAFLAQTPVLALSFILVIWKANVKLPAQQQTAKEKIKRIDFLGSLTLVIGISSLLLGITLKASEELPWSTPIVWGLLMNSIVFLFGFILAEKYVAVEPILPMRLLTARTPLAIAMANFFTSITAFSMLYNVPLYFTTVRLNSATEAGLHLMPNSVALAIGSVMAGVAMRATGKYYRFTLASAVAAVISSILVSNWNDYSSPLHLWLDIVPGGLGVAALITSTLIALIASVGREDIAVATGISYLFRTTGQVLGVSLTGALLQGLLISNLRERIHGPNKDELIQMIRHSTTIIPSLDPPIRQAAVESYAASLRVIFMVQTCVALCTVISCIFVQENPLPGSLEEHDEQDRLRKARTQSTAAQIR